MNSGDEQFVREHWEHVIVCDGSYRHYVKGTVLLNWANHCFHEFTDFAAARAYTESRLQQISEIEEEIREVDYVSKYFSGERKEAWSMSPVPKQKWISLAQKQLQRGMKTGREPQ